VNRVKSERYRVKHINGYPIHETKVESVTGRIYTFREQEAPAFLKKRGTMYGFKPTEIKNYFVQGLATADFVPMVAGHLYRMSLKKGIECKWVNTVHDSLLAETDDLEAFVRFIHSSLDHIDTIVRERLVPDWNLPIKYTIEAGTSWADKKEIEHGND
ncbi:MAG: hypothetical protein D6698_08945, partial [Gammaproteobacteria bacterium]